MDSGECRDRVGEVVDVVSRWLVVAVALVGVAVSGCSEKSRSAPGCVHAAGAAARPSGRYVTSPRGVRVWAPDWLRGSMLSEALAEVDDVEPEADSRIATGTRGVPVGVEVTIMDPGSFSTPASASGLARGQTDMASSIVVSWRMQPWETRPLMPALAHEVRHLMSRDAQAGH